jgi:hypothetical protein
MWEYVVGELDKRIEQAREQLTTVQPEELVRAQTKLRALVELKRLPDDIIEREQP